DQPDLNDILTVLNQIQLDNQALHQENTDLRNTLEQLHAQGGANYHKEPKVSLPDKFDGSRANFRGFLNQVRLVVCMQPNRYPNDQSQVGLLGSLLTGPALAWFAPLLEKQSPLLENFTELVREFEATFGDSDKSRTAANKIRKLTQGPRPASSYASEFRQIADPTSLNDAISKAVRCDNRLFERKQERHQNLFSQKYQSQTLGDPTTSAGELMQIDAARFRPLTEEEKKWRRTNNLCLYCGAPGHIARSCPNKCKTTPRIDAIVTTAEMSGKEETQSQ
ncbi:5345_t:CDS:2, partial [Dentiscutata heterogama]